MIRVLLADDHLVVRAGIARILEAASDIHVVGEVSDGHAVLERLAAGGIDVVLLDIGMPGPGFMEVLGRARDGGGERVAVLVLSVHPEEQFALRALRAGAAGYLTKDRTPEELLTAVRRVAAGGKYVSAALAERLAAAVGATAAAGHEALSDREFQVLRLLGAGKTVGDVARTLSLSPKTVSTYRTRILQKLHLETTAELVRYAVEHGLVGR